MKDHLESVFRAAGGDVESEMEEDVLVFHVHTCPAIQHMKDQGYDIAPQFCEHTRIVNESICGPAGYECSADYDQEAGRCVQRFWRAGA